MATAADWMSAASFLSMAGIIAFLGRDGSVYLMGWTGGYVLLALLLAPYLRKFGKYTVPDFIGTRYYSRVARVVAVVCLIFVSFTYVAGQMRGVGIVFSRFLEVDINTGVIVGMAIVFIYAVLGGMKGITYTQVAQYCVLIFAYLVPAIFISIMITGNPIPQLGLGAISAEGTSVLTKLDNILQDLGFSPIYHQSKIINRRFRNYCGIDVWNRLIAARSRQILYCSKSIRRKKICRLCTCLHSNSLHNSTRCRKFCPA